MRRIPGFGARGFTLVELMITVAIVSILAAIAYPSFQEYVRRTHRAQAKADLVEYVQLAERFHTVNNTYVGFDLPSAVSPREGSTVRYNIAFVVPPTQSTISVEATTTGAQTKDQCGNLALTQAGVKSNSEGTLAECW